MASYDVVTSKVVWEGVLSTARVDTLEMPDATTADREVVAHLDAVAVVALTRDDEVVLVRQYRHPLRCYQLEVPAGLLDEDDEDPAEAARRELAEEAGAAVAALEPVTRFANSAGWTDEHTTVYVGVDASWDGRPDDFSLVHEEAEIEVVTLPFETAVEQVLDGTLSDAKTALGILAVDALRRRGRV
jgi:8-oxo-dGDP phosphatase